MIIICCNILELVENVIPIGDLAPLDHAPPEVDMMCVMPSLAGEPDLAGSILAMEPWLLAELESDCTELADTRNLVFEEDGSWQE